MQRIKTIEIRFPNLSKFEKKENEFLFKILSQLGNVERKSDSSIVFGNPKLHPNLIFKKSSINNPQISFITSDRVKNSWQTGDLRLGFNLSEEKEVQIPRNIDDCELLKDKIGNYTRLKLGSKKYSILSIEQVFERFDGKLKSLNHAGVNFGPKILSESDYINIKKLISEKSNLYKYPTGEEWPFIIPSTESEFWEGITDLTFKRDPKFEIVYSNNHKKPFIQLDLETNLSEVEVIELLPSPYGVSDPKLKKDMRNVFIMTDWLGVILRFDLRFKYSGEDFGYWMIKEGGRIL